MKAELVYLFMLPLLCLYAFISQSETKLHAETNSASLTAVTMQDTIPYIIAQNYFVKNTVDSISDPTIESKDVFDSCFGFATRSGSQGKPTAVDFTREFAIAVILPKSNFAMNIIPVSLTTGNDDTIVFHYKIEEAGKQSFTSRSFVLLFVDKKFNRNLALKRIK
jgi:hypothetical protein